MAIPHPIKIQNKRFKRLIFLMEDLFYSDECCHGKFNVSLLMMRECAMLDGWIFLPFQTKYDY